MDLKTFFIIIEILGILIMVAEFIFILFQKPSNLQKILLILALTCISSLVTYYFELKAENQQAAYLACILSYASKPYSLIATLYFLLEYSRVKVKKSLFILLFIFYFSITMIVFTNGYHHLYYSTVSFNPEAAGSGIVVTHGIFWYIYMASLFIVFIIYTIIGLEEYKKSKTKQAKTMAAYLIVMLGCCMVGLVFFILGLTGGYDTTLTGTFFGAIVLLILLVRYHLFDSIDLGKEKLLSDSTSALIVFDARSRVSYYNDAALSLFPELADITKTNKDYELLEKLEKHVEDKKYYHGDMVYSVSINIAKVKDHIKKNQELIVGKSFVYSDITEEVSYQKRLEKDVEEATSKIKDIQRSILVSFANLIEARDGYTGAHVKNVSKYARMISEELAKNPDYQDQLDDNTVDVIEECAPLHDVGKIFISDSLLGKPGKLTKEEFEKMKTHTLMGGETIDNTIKGIEEPFYVELAKEIAICHHEWWDGSGYPSGLKGTEIPLSARIMAVADVYDALRMKRPYKDAFPKDKAIEIIKEESGTHFDPDVVKAFLNIVNVIE